MERYRIVGGNLILPQGICPGEIVVENGIIADIKCGAGESADGPVLDARGRYVSPGFIDMHVHGGGGSDFMDGTPQAFRTIAETHLRHGTTALVATTLTSTPEELEQVFQAYAHVKDEPYCGAEILGVHLEGPYLSQNQRGAQDPRYIRLPCREEYSKILDRHPEILRWTIAPELDGAMEMGRELEARGILPCIGHSEAEYQDVLRAQKNGYRHVTHLYSGMSGVTRKDGFRHAGVIESALLLDDLTVEIIADGCHLPECLLKLIWKCKGTQKIALITDAMRAAGTDAEQSILGSLSDGQTVIVEDGVAKMPDRKNFAGSVATADRLVRTMVELADVPLESAVKMITQSPASILGLEKTKGSLEPGKDADIVLFGSHIDVSAVIRKGRCLWAK